MSLERWPSRPLCPVQPVRTAHLFRPLARELVILLRSLDAEAWKRPTAAGSWNVRELAAHLLHGDLRKLSGSRLEGSRPAGHVDFAELVELIDADNARGVGFLSTLSPQLITDLLEVTGRSVVRLFASLPPDAPARTNVAWAGEAVSVNWTDVGRELTERWHHQVHIRDAVGVPGLLMSRRWVEPILRLSVLALRRTYAQVDTEPGTAVVLRVHGAWRHRWSMVRGLSGWELVDGAAPRPDADVSLDCEIACRSFFGLPSEPGARARAELRGDVRFAEPILATRSLMIREAI